MEKAILNAKKAPPSGKKWASNMLMFHFDVKTGFGFKKTTRFNDSESTLSFERR